MSSKAALSSLKRRKARGVKQCVNSPFCQPEDKGPLGTLLGGLALLVPGAAKKYHISSAAHYLELIFGCGALYYNCLKGVCVSEPSLLF